jgi:hypothetical protein
MKSTIKPANLHQQLKYIDKYRYASNGRKELSEMHFRDFEPI